MQKKTEIAKLDMKPTTLLKCLLPASDDDMFRPDLTAFVVMHGDTYKHRHLFPKLHQMEQAIPGTDIILPRLQGAQKARFVSASECSKLVSTLRLESDPIVSKLKDFEGKVIVQ